MVTKAKKQTQCSQCRKRLTRRQVKFCSKECVKLWRADHPEERKGGAPDKLTLDVQTKLINAFQRGLNVTEACTIAGISTKTYDRHYAADEVFGRKIDRAQSFPDRRSKEVVVEAINNGDTVNARWWLERRQPRQFAQRQKQEITGAEGVPLETVVIYRPEKLPDSYFKRPSTVDNSMQNVGKKT